MLAMFDVQYILNYHSGVALAWKCLRTDVPNIFVSIKNIRRIRSQ